MRVEDYQTTTGDDWIIEDETIALSADMSTSQYSWRVLIVDDDPDVHSVTRLSLRNVAFKNRSLELLSAYSGAEAFDILRDTNDIALVLLDVVMETDDAGLKLVKRIRGELNNQITRIVLRTGQPGQAPEQKIIVEYDINDYKAKTELTTQKLFTSVIASLRAYESLLTIERSRVGLNKILEGAGNLYQIQSLRDFASGVLKQVSAILNVGFDGVLCVRKGGVSKAAGTSHLPAVIAATGKYADLADAELLPSNHQLAHGITKTFQEKHSQYVHPANVLFIHTHQGHELTVSITPPWPLEEIQREMLEIFCHRIASAFDNLYLFEQLHKSQESTVVALANLAEFRDEGTGGHVRRVQMLTDAIANNLLQRDIYTDELTPQFMDMVGMASILHDVGKVATPDHILLKPGIHTPEERVIMQKHAQVGETVLARAANLLDGASYLTYGAQIAGGHHEHFDGNGYPRGLKALDIPLSARIVAVVDVFDALLHRRVYKEAWSYPDTIDYIRQRRGTQFDPHVVDALFAIAESAPPEWMLLEE
jgi:response regulator RpfG family c-di-GMP phosphodiesterase